MFLCVWIKLAIIDDEDIITMTTVRESGGCDSWWFGGGCTHQAKSGTKVALACLGCDQTCYYHDVVMVGGRPSPLTNAR